MIGCERLPAEGFSHAGVFHIVVRGETLDQHGDHLDGDVLHQAGQGDGGVKGGVCQKSTRVQLLHPTISFCISGQIAGGYHDAYLVIWQNCEKSRRAVTGTP